MRWWILPVLFFSSFGVMAEQQDVKRAVAWVAKYAPDCTLADGYVCADIQEDDFLSRHADRISVPGDYLLAWQVAMTDFQQLDDLEPERKSLKHYRIGFTESTDDFIVLFDALLLPRINSDGDPQGILTVTYGRSTKYWIDKKTRRINKRLFLK